MTAWDRALAARTATLWALLMVLAGAVLIATDEMDATSRARFARLCALAPALATLAMVAVAKRLESAGDLRALAALGVTRRRALGGSLVVAIGLGLSAAVALLLGWGSLDGLFPPLSGDVWRSEGGGFAAPGISLASIDGAVTFATSHEAVDNARTSRTAVGATVALFAVALPSWIAVPETWPVRSLVGLGLVLAAIVGFHAVSAGRSPALLVAPPLALLAYLGTLALRSRLHELRHLG